MQEDTRVFIDTNVVLDALLERGSNCSSARSILLLSCGNVIHGFTTTKQISDIYYVLKKNIKDEKQIRSVLKSLFNTFDVVALKKDDGLLAIDYPFDDYEDGLIHECARTYFCKYLVTSNKKHFKDNQDYQVMLPNEFVDFIASVDNIQNIL